MLVASHCGLKHRPLLALTATLVSHPAASVCKNCTISTTCTVDIKAHWYPNKFTTQSLELLYYKGCLGIVESHACDQFLYLYKMSMN